MAAIRKEDCHKLYKHGRVSHQTKCKHQVLMAAIRNEGCHKLYKHGRVSHLAKCKHQDLMATIRKEGCHSYISTVEYHISLSVSVRI